MRGVREDLPLLLRFFGTVILAAAVAVGLILLAAQTGSPALLGLVSIAIIVAGIGTALWRPQPRWIVRFTDWMLGDQ